MARGGPAYNSRVGRFFKGYGGSLSIIVMGLQKQVELQR